MIDDRDAREEIDISGIEIAQQQPDHLILQGAPAHQQGEIGLRFRAGRDRRERELKTERPSLDEFMQACGGVGIHA